MSYVSDAIPSHVPVDRFPRRFALIIAVLLLCSVLGVVLSIVQAININQKANVSADRAAIASARNRIDVLESRIRSEEGHECIARYQREVVTAFAEGRQSDVPFIDACKAEDLPQIREELEDAKRRLATLVGSDDYQLEGE